MPLLSVIIPTCRRNEDLDRCLRSLIRENQDLSITSAAQSFDVTGRPDFDFETIVTGDGTNSTAEAMLQTGFPFVRWVRGPRRGPAANRNHGAENAQGDWLLFLDDDCIPDPKWVGLFFSQVQALTAAFWKARPFVLDKKAERTRLPD
jgi:glycosyltransferase involved in cell wall biosynthesis